TQTFSRQFDGTSWSAPTAISGNAKYPSSFTKNPQGQPVLVYEDGSIGKAVIYDGSAWQPLGNDLFDDGSTINHYVSVRFASDGTAYAAFKTGSSVNGGVVHLYQLINGIWNQLAQWDSNGTRRAALAINPLTNAPYVAYVNRSLQAEVKMWNGFAMVDTTSMGTLATNADNLSLAFGEDGKGYLAFVDISTSTPNVIRYVPEHTPPSLVAAAPLAGATDVDPNADLTATFNEPIKGVAGHGIEICTADESECRQMDAGSTGVSISGTVATIDFPGGLKGVTSYRATAEAGAFADLNDNPAPALEWTFTTAAAVPDAPVIDVVNAGDASVFVTFGAPYNGGSEIDHYTITLHPYSGGTDIVENVTGTLYFRAELTNGVTYGVTVTATNGAGTSAPSSERTFVPSSTPGAPTITGVTVGNRTAAVSFDPPSYDGFSPITEYYVYAKQGGVTKRGGTGTASPITVTGLTNGETYSFTVVAKNIRGESAESSALTGTPATKPGAPADVTATGGILRATVSFTPPASNGGSPITGYRITSIPANPLEDRIAVTVGPDATSAEVNGLWQGQSYHFNVVAINALGESAAAQTVSLTRTNTIPSMPINVSATAGDAKAFVSFGEPDNGGQAITNYRVTAWAGAVAAGQSEGLTSPIEVTGLQNGTAYTFTVEAFNRLGGSPPSNPSNAVTPTAAVVPSTVPDAPTNVTATAGDGTATVSFTAPANDGGSAITGYTVTASPGGAQAQLGAGENTAQFTGLTNGTTYTFTVAANNAVGASVPSDPSNAVTPTAPSLPPTPTGPIFTSPPSNSYSVSVWWNGESLGTLEVNRKQQPDGSFEETALLTAAFVEQAAAKLKAGGQTRLTIGLPNRNDKNLVTWKVDMPINAVRALAAAGIDLLVSTENADAYIPSESLKGWEQALSLSISPVQEAERISGIGTRAGQDPNVRKASGNGEIIVLGKPVAVTTNLRGDGRGIALTLPLGGKTPDESQLRDIGVYIEHEDGTRELVKGSLTTIGDQKEPAITFDVSKFSTFAIVSIEGWGDYGQTAAQAPYISGYGGGLFKPESSLTRAELAEILRKLYADKLPVTSTATLTFTDVPAAHWAKEAIDAVAKLGLMKGMPDGMF
ncbi:MAG: fibronectin type III domain-containing protein, partial [Cohnella sp.]|nr:fibronectin type III domain-containing protein [Cohnella sp.]